MNLPRNLRNCLCFAIWVICLTCRGRDFSFFEPVQPPRACQAMVHRGEAGQAPENSRPALVRCIEDNLEWAEVDVRLTKDGHHVLVHDEALRAGTNVPMRVAEHTQKACLICRFWRPSVA